MASDPVDTSGEAIGRSITELLSWLTGPDSGQNDGLVTAANQLAALADERNSLRGDLRLTAQQCGDFQRQMERAIHERDASLAAASREQEARAEAGRLRRAWLTTIQVENSCDGTGAPCREAKRCGCREEMEMLLREDDARAALAQEPRHD